jgi:light-regulated signal transduction histidine kinase (bacteriophytochrome)
MGQLIDDLLAFSRTGRKELQKQEIDMTALAKNTLDEVKASMPDFNATVDIQQMPKAYADLNLLQLVFTNLLNNAVKYSAKKSDPEITVGSTNRDDGIVYFVKDNGIGFDMKYYDKLFGVFQRLHSAEEFEGTGVGLALIKRIITRHGGRIWAEAQVGAGATFYFTLTR